MGWPFSSSVPPPHEPSNTPYKPRNKDEDYFTAISKCQGLDDDKKSFMNDQLNEKWFLLMAFMESYDADPTDECIQRFYKQRIETFARRMLHTTL
jgi:hypothetical protein